MNERMTSLPVLSQPMTAAEARTCVSRIVGAMTEAREALLDLYERRGWEALGYQSWRECVAAEFGQSQTHLYRQLQAAEIERRVLTSVPISPMGEKPSIPERQLRPLAVLSVDAQPAAWRQAVETAPGGKVTAAHVQRTVDEIRRPTPITRVPYVDDIPDEHDDVVYEPTDTQVFQRLSDLAGDPDGSRARAALATRVANKHTQLLEFIAIQPDAIAAAVDGVPRKFLVKTLPDIREWLDRLEAALTRPLSVIEGGRR